MSPNIPPNKPPSKHLSKHTKQNKQVNNETMKWTAIKNVVDFWQVLRKYCTGSICDTIQYRIF